MKKTAALKPATGNRGLTGWCMTNFHLNCPHFMHSFNDKPARECGCECHNELKGSSK